MDAAFIDETARNAARGCREAAEPCAKGQTMKYEGKLRGRALTPRSARIDVRYDALVRFETSAVEAAILNVSSKGFCLRAAEELEPGMEVTIEVEKLRPVRGQIRWTCGEESGGVFLEAIAL